jgi:hypothetical protein
MHKITIAAEYFCKMVENTMKISVQINNNMYIVEKCTKLYP